MSQYFELFWPSTKFFKPFNRDVASLNIWFQLAYIFYNFISLFSPCFSFDWEDISNTQGSAYHIWFSKHLKFVKNTVLWVVFSTIISVFGKVAKHGLLCFIYDMTYPCNLQSQFDLVEIKCKKPSLQQH